MKITLVDEGNEFELSTVSDISISIEQHCNVISSIHSTRQILPVGDATCVVSLRFLNLAKAGEIPNAEVWNELGFKDRMTLDTSPDWFEDQWQKKKEFEIEISFEEGTSLIDRLFLEKCVIADFVPITLNEEKFEVKILSRRWYVS